MDIYEKIHAHSRCIWSDTSSLCYSSVKSQFYYMVFAKMNKEAVRNWKRQHLEFSTQFDNFFWSDETALSWDKRVKKYPGQNLTPFRESILRSLLQGEQSEIYTIQTENYSRVAEWLKYKFKQNKKNLICIPVTDLPPGGGCKSIAIVFVSSFPFSNKKHQYIQPTNAEPDLRLSINSAC